jgi:hypothetical protein
MTYPEAGTEAAGAANPDAGPPPAWQSYPEIPVRQSPTAVPAAGYDLFRQSNNTAEHEISMGLSDKIGAAVLATGHALGVPSPYDKASASDNWADAYRKNLDAIRNEGEQFSETNPTASKVATGAGIVGSAAALPSEGIAATAGLLPKMVEGAKIGAGAGAAAGFGASSDKSLTGDLASTATGAGLGTIIGGAGAAVADRVVAPIYNWAARKFGPDAVNNQAIQAVAKRMTQDQNASGPTAQDMLDILNSAPEKPLALADVAGQNARQYAGSIARQPGEGQQFARTQLEGRDLGAGPRLAGDIAQGVATGGSTFDTNEALMQARSAAAAPKYDKAFQAQQVWSPRLQQFLDDPVMQQGLNRGMELERIDSVTQQKPFDPTTLGVDLDQEGNVKLTSAPNMRVLDAGKRGLDSMIADERNPITGRLSQRGVSLDQFRRAYLGELDGLDTSGNYAAARSAWSGPSASMDALQGGQTILNKSPAEIAADVDRLNSNSPGDLEFYKLGAANALQDKIAKTGMGGDEAKRLIGNQYTQQQLRPLFDGPDDYDRFINSVTAENRMFETKQKLIGGSQTAERMAEDNGGEGGAAGHALRGTVALAEGAPGAAGLSYVKALGSLMRGESPKVNAAASKILFTPQTAQSDPTIFSNLGDIIAAQQQKTAPRIISIPASAAAGANPAPTLSSVLAASQYLPSSQH